MSRQATVLLKKLAEDLGGILDKKKIVESDYPFSWELIYKIQFPSATYSELSMILYEFIDRWDERHWKMPIGNAMVGVENVSVDGDLLIEEEGSQLSFSSNLKAAIGQAAGNLKILALCYKRSVTNTLRFHTQK